MNHSDMLIERATAAAAGTYTSSGVSVFGAFTANDAAAIGGLAVAVLAFIVNWTYRHKAFKFEKKVAEARLKKLDEKE